MACAAGMCCSVACCLRVPGLGWVLRKCCLPEEIIASSNGGSGATGGGSVSMNQVVLSPGPGGYSPPGVSGTGAVAAGCVVVGSQTMAANGRDDCDGDSPRPLTRQRSVTWSPKKYTVGAPLPAPPMTTPKGILRRQSMLAAQGGPAAGAGAAALNSSSPGISPLRRAPSLPPSDSIASSLDLSACLLDEAEERSPQDPNDML